MTKIFIEYGLDFDNNKYWIGRSTEIEYDNGTEIRTCKRVRIGKIKSRYIRVWIGKFVFIIDSDKPHFVFRKKNKLNFKIVYGIRGY